jgi:hypothetical protein
MQQILPIDKESAVISKLRLIYGNAANIQIGYVRLEKELTASSTSEIFTLGEGRSNGTKRPLENFLSQNDNFVPLYLRVGLQKQLLEIGGDPVNGNNGNQPVYTYPDLTVFSNAAVAPNLSEADALEGVYSGNLSLKSNTYEVVNKMDLTRFRRVPQTQFGITATGGDTNQASSGEILEGYQKLDIVPVFEGKKRNEVIFNYAQGADAAAIGGTAGTDKNILVLHFWGFIIRNASEPTAYSELMRDGILR